MLYKLKGKVEKRLPESLVISLGPISLQISAPGSLIANLKENEEVELYTHLYIREKELELFGFAELEQQKMFYALTDISGIGPKTALGVLSQNSVEEIKKSVLESNTQIFTAVPGIGKKNANRIVLELKNQMEKDFDLSFLEKDEVADQVIIALHSLGYNKKEAREALRQVDSQLDLQERIKECLRILGQNK